MPRGNIPSNDNDFLEQAELFQGLWKYSMGSRIDTGMILRFCFSGKNFDSTKFRSKDLNGADFGRESSSRHF